jgi:hypothetical protein
LIIVGLFFPIVAVAGYLAIAIYYIVPFRYPRDIVPFRRKRQRPPLP